MYINRFSFCFHKIKVSLLAIVLKVEIWGSFVFFWSKNKLAAAERALHGPPEAAAIYQGDLSRIITIKDRILAQTSDLISDLISDWITNLISDRIILDLVIDSRRGLPTVLGSSNISRRSFRNHYNHRSDLGSDTRSDLGSDLGLDWITDLISDLIRSDLVIDSSREGSTRSSRGSSNISRRWFRNHYNHRSDLGFDTRSDLGSDQIRFKSFSTDLLLSLT